MRGGSPSPSIPAESFSFRVQCYEQFGWSPETVANIPATEADMLSIYFEETAAYQYKQNKKYSSPSSSHGGEIIDIEIGDEDDAEYDGDGNG